MSDQPPTRAVGRDLAIIIAIGALFTVPGLFTRDPWPPDEARYMEVAREMAVTGDYVLPHLAGAVYTDKPPLFFWLAAALYKLGFGINAGRVVAALAALGTLLATYFLAKRVLPPSDRSDLSGPSDTSGVHAHSYSPGPLVATLVTLTCGLFVEAKLGVIDPLLTLFIVAAISSGHKAFQPKTTRRAVWWVGSYAFVALAVLTKGPVGLAVPALVLLAYGLANRARVRSGALGHVIGAPIMLTLVLGWFIPAAIAGGADYWREILLGHVVSNIVKAPNHGEPPHYFLTWYPLFFAPWSLLFPLAVAAAIATWRHSTARLPSTGSGRELVERSSPKSSSCRPEHVEGRRAEEDGDRFALIWFAVMFVFFSAMSSKRAGYLMPLAPAVGLLIGRYVSAGIRDGLRWPRWCAALLRITYSVLALAGAAGAAALIARPQVRDLLAGRGSRMADLALASFTPAELALGVCTALAVVALAIYGFRAARKHGGRMRSLAPLVAIILTASLAADLLVMPRVDPFKSPRTFCESARQYLVQAERVYLLKGRQAGAYNLYSGLIKTPVLRTADEVREALSSATRTAIIADQVRRKELVGAECPHRIAVVEFADGALVELIVNWDMRTRQPLGAPVPESRSSPDTKGK